MFNESNYHDQHNMFLKLNGHTKNKGKKVLTKGKG
jgi:hypothetical protein